MISFPVYFIIHSSKRLSRFLWIQGRWKVKKNEIASRNRRSNSWRKVLILSGTNCEGVNGTPGTHSSAGPCTPGSPDPPLPPCPPDPPVPLSPLIPLPPTPPLVEAKAVRLSCVHPSLIVMLTLCQKLCQVFQFATMNFEGSSIVMNWQRYKARPCPFIQILYRFYLDFILIFWFYFDFILILSR